MVVLVSDNRCHFFHIDILATHRKFLRFEHQSSHLGFDKLPRVLNSCVQAALSPLTHSNIWIFLHIRSYLIRSHTQEQAIRDSDVTSHKTIATHTMCCLSRQNLPLLPCHSVGREDTVIQTVFSPLLLVRITAEQTLLAATE